MRQIEKREYIIDVDEFRAKFPEVEGGIKTIFFNYDRQQIEIEVEL
jgi:hypothetical protein